MANSTDLRSEAVKLANLAVNYDQEGDDELALFYYLESAQTLLLACEDNGPETSSLRQQASQYLDRAEVLKGQKAGKPRRHCPKSQTIDTDVDRAKFILNQAFEADSTSQSEEAISLYSQAVELFLDIRKKSSDRELQDKVGKLAGQALDRAEELKKIDRPSTSTVPTSTSFGDNNDNTSAAVNFLNKPLGFMLQDNMTPAERAKMKGSSNQQRRGPIVIGAASLSKSEIAVLRFTSVINGREYLPFVPADIRDRFAFPVPFTDRFGKLALSRQQMNLLGSWARPDEFMDSPRMIFNISCFSIKQTLVSDCSFVASLAISAQYERRFHRKLISFIIYPQNRAGEPLYNPCGKYMVKLNINGVPRKVIIDDYLPMDRHGGLLCSYSTNRNELWISLLEKAYMKVMGGYDFPGSNSNIDLNALTGWIPERISIKKDPREFDSGKEFSRILERFHRGHCLVTIATGAMSDAEADRAGLVPTHAYAMLDIREIQGKKLMQLMNPWRHLRWRGNFSENDTNNWTPSLMKALNYDKKSAEMFDNGVFWIDYESVLRFYDVIYISWDPALFQYTYCYHDCWQKKEGPQKDSYDMSDNPQYRLEINSSPSNVAIWVLLTRHITDKDDFADNKEFITLLVFKNEGKKVFYPYDPPPYKDGIRINSPHYLCKMVEPAGSHKFTLVISQYEKNNTIRYTLRVYANYEFSMNKIIDPYKREYEKKVTGEWKGRTAGGCGNYPDTYRNNPIYQITMENSFPDNALQFELKGPKEYNVGFDVTCVSKNVSGAPGEFSKTTSGSYRRGYAAMQLNNIPGGVYNCVPTTFRPGQEAPFFLIVNSKYPYKISKLQ